MQIILDLCPMLVRKVRHSLQFNHDFTVTDKIRYIVLLKRVSFVAQGKGDLAPCWNFLNPKLNPKTLLKNRLQKTAALLFINLKASAEYPIRFFLMY